MSTTHSLPLAKAGAGVVHDWREITWIGPKRHLDDHGFLVCKEVPVARIGTQLYGPGETPIQCDDMGVVRIERSPEEVFRAETLASLVGKPVVNDHPIDAFGERCDVTPENWRGLAVGHVENPRRGSGALADYLLADLVICDRDAIDLINAHGKRQISLGYNAEYDELGPGHGRQRDIIINHAALVDEARCGPMCAIGDSIKHNQEEESMAKTGSTWRDRIRKAFRARDQEELENALTDAEKDDDDDDNGEGESSAGGEHHVHVHIGAGAGGGEAGAGAGGNGGEGGGMENVGPEEIEELWAANQAETEAIERLAAAVGGDSPRFRDAKYPHRDARRRRMGIRVARDQDRPDETEEEKNKREADEAAERAANKTLIPEFEIEAPPGARSGDASRARDSALLEESFAETLALGEILVPGLKLPVFDRATAPKKTFDAMCGFRRQVLELAYAQPEGRGLIDEYTGSRFAGARDLPCARVREIFRAVGYIKKRAADTAGTARIPAAVTGFGGAVTSGPAGSLAAMQKQLDDFYKEK